MLLSPYSGVINAYVILAGQKPGSTSYNEHKSFIDAQGQTAYIAALNSAFAGVSNAAMGTLLLNNTGLSGVFTQAEAESYLAANQANRVQAVLDLAASLSSYAGPSEAILAAKATFVATVSNAYAYASVAGNTTDAATSATSVNTGTTITLTTAVDDANGGDGDDVINGILGTSGTYTVADDINGGAGTDTLNLLTNGSAIAGGLVSLDSIETVNVRVLASAGEAVTLTAADWDGVGLVTNASSLANSVLQVTGLEVTTDVMLSGVGTINAGFNNTTTAAAAVDVILSDAGSIALGANFSSGSAATMNVDANTTGLISAVNVNLAGTTNLAVLEGGANVKTYTVNGAAAGILTTNDTITSFNAAGADGGVDMTFSGASDVVAVGGAGDDTFRFNATYTNSDSFDGGAGDDTIAVTIGGFNRNLNTTNVENATVTFTETSGGTLNASASSVTDYTFVAGSNNAVSLSQVASSATFTLNDANVNGLTLDFASGASLATLNIGSASGVVNIGDLTVTDVSSVAINSVGSGAAIEGTTFDTDLRTLSVNSGAGEADIDVAKGSAIALSGATTVTLTSQGSAGISFGSAITGDSLGTLTVNAAGSEAADVVFASATFAGTAISTITLNGSDGADISVGTLNVGSQSTGAAKALTIAANVNGASSDITVGAINFTGMGTLTLDINQAATADVVFGAISLDNMASTGGAGNFVLTDTAVIAGSTAGIATIVSRDGASGQMALGSITVGAGAQFSAGTITLGSADYDVSNITIDVGASGDGFIGAMNVSAGVIGDISLTVAANASGQFGAIAASGLGSIQIDLAGATGFVDFGLISAGAGNVGTIEVLAGADGSDVTMGLINASAIGDISVAGNGDFTGSYSANSMGTITSTQGVSGAFTIDLSKVVGAVEVNVGAATNVITSGAGNDVITLTAGTTGNDTIVFTTATQAADNIANFGAGSTGGDVIQINSSALPLIGAEGNALATATTVSFATASGASVTLATAAVITLFTTAYASTAAFLADATADMTLLNSAAATAGSLLVVWGDGNDSYVSMLNFNEGGSGAAGVLSLNASASGISLTTLASLAGVSAGELIAANFDLG